MKRLLDFIPISLLLAIMLWQCTTPAREAGNNLENGFLTPPHAAAPRVWWHWMNGNITKEGIRADLEWMHRVGIGGFQNFDAALMTPQVVDKRLIYMTPEWKDAFLFTTRLADSLGLEMAIAGSPGWSESGGPWVKPEQAMKKYVWSEIIVEGGKAFSGMLPQPPSTTGTFQNIPLRETLSLAVTSQEVPPQLYTDAAVIAFRVPDTELSMLSLQPKVTSSDGKFSLESLTDGDLATATELPYSRPGEDAWICFDFKQPVAVQALTIVGGGFGGQFGFGADRGKRTLEKSDNGKNFEKVTDIPIGGVQQRTLTFPAVTARFFRFTWLTPEPQPAFDFGALFGGGNRTVTKGPTGTPVAELALHTIPRVNRFEEKAAFATAADLYEAPTPDIQPENAVPKTDVIDLTPLMKPDGKLDWTPPPGNWKIIRLGYSLTGHKNSPASPEATGLEVDKLDAGHVKSYFTNYLDQYKEATGGLMGSKGLQYMITDSWEAGTQNWTDNIVGEFSLRRGYSMIPWIPVLTGQIVESSQASDRFLWDFRLTLADLVAENHYDQLTEILKERGMKRYTESHESGRAFIGDGMEVKKNAAVPMSATWTPGGLDPGTEVAERYKADVRESASVAHIYGQNLVAAESMTAIGSAWAWSPELLKPTADMEMANGLNRFVIHTSVHQPVDDKIPGLGLGPFGQWFTRHETWAEQAGAWIKYLARSCYMLQQGTAVADILWYYGEDNNITALFGQKLPDVPEGYSYDFVNADALLNALTVKNGQLHTPGGTVYKLLVLDANSRYMTLPVLKKIRDLVNSGATVAGEKPLATPSLADNPDEFANLVNQLWPAEKGETIIGKGRVITGKTLQEVLDGMQLSPDFSYSGPEENTKLLFVHRQHGNTDIYWVNNRNNQEENIDAAFRVNGKEAEIWHPVTGKMEMSSYSMIPGGTKVPLHLEPNDAVFVVFRKSTGKTERILPKPKEETLTTLEGPWKVSFQAHRGAPAEISFDTLSAWNNHPDPGIRYFSGTASYFKTIQVPEDWLNRETSLWLDLGMVQNLAEVVLNGQNLGVVWKTPFKINISEALKKGGNNLEIRVTNLWVNRLIGDQQPDAKEKFTYTTMPFYRADSPLKPSGLAGPVSIFKTYDGL